MSRICPRTPKKIKPVCVKRPTFAQSIDGERTPTAESFHAMHQRTGNSRHHKFYLYGAVGIGVCTRWSGKDGFKNFLADLGERPAGTTLGRYLDSGNYEPGNCCWMTSSQQGAERRGHTAMKRLRVVRASGLSDSKTKAA